MKQNGIDQIVREYGQVLEFVSMSSQFLFPSTFYPESLLPHTKESIAGSIQMALEISSKKSYKMALEVGLEMLNCFIDDHEAYRKNHMILKNNDWWKSIKK